jgi:phosphatidate cytidylyltransferase
MHLKRWITALIALPFLIIIISKGGAFIFSLCLCIGAAIAFYEYLSIVFKPNFSFKDPLLIIGILSSAAIIWSFYFNNIKLFGFFIIADFFLCAFISFFKYKKEPYIIENIIKQVFGLIYIALFISFMVLIRNSEGGIIWIYLLLLLVGAGDTGAFYTGSYFGKTKLCPSVSPNKTIEGSLGGLFLCIIIGCFIKFFFISDISWVKAFLMFVSVNIAGQAGDLFESELKRFSHVKDSGKILPGHGGILDRIDALLFAAPVVYLFKEVL